MTYVATDLSGASKTAAKTAPRMERTRTVSDQPMVAANLALTRVNGGLKTGSNNAGLVAGVGVVALLALGGGTWALTHHAAPAQTTATAPTATPLAATPLAAAPLAPTINAPSSPAPALVSKQAAAPIAGNPTDGDSRAITDSRRNHVAPVAIRSLRTPASRAGSGATNATPVFPASAPDGLSSKLAPQPLAVTPPVISPAPETPEAPPIATTSAAAPAPTAINPAPQTVTPTPASPATTDAPSAPQPQ